MPDLDPKAADLLWPALQILGLLVFIVSTGLVAFWRGFKWLKGQIEETAKAMLGPIAKDVVKAQTSSKAAHKRISRLRADLKLPPDHQDDYEEASA